MNFEITSIGLVNIKDQKYSIKLDTKYIPALTNIEGFSHLQILWWGHLTDAPAYREQLVAEKLFKKGPGRMGIFGTRAPARPNPIMSSTIQVQKIDPEKGIIYTPFIDAENDSPVLDIKPYYKMERVKKCQVPQWCSHWPQWAEEASTFNWNEEINFPGD